MENKRLEEIRDKLIQKMVYNQTDFGEKGKFVNVIYMTNFINDMFQDKLYKHYIPISEIEEILERICGFTCPNGAEENKPTMKMIEQYLINKEEK